MIKHAYSNVVADGTATSVVRPSDWNSGHVQAMSLSGNTVGVSSFSANEVVFQGGPNVTLSAAVAGSIATLLVSAASPTPVYALANSNGIVFGTSNGQVTASYTVPNTFAQTQQPLAYAAGGTTKTGNTLGFLDGNGVSFSTGAGGVRASVQTNYAASDITTNAIPLASSAAFQATSATSAITSAAMPVANSSIYQHTTGNSLFQYRSNTSAITSNAIHSSQSSLFTGGGGTGYVATSQSSLFQHTSATSAITANAFATANSSLLQAVSATSNITSNAFPSASSTKFAGTGFTGVNVSGTVNSNGLSLSVASGGGGGGGGNAIAVAGSTAGSAGTVLFANANGISFGMNGSTITASAAGAGGAGIAMGIPGNTVSNGVVVLDNNTTMGNVRLILNTSTMYGVFDQTIIMRQSETRSNGSDYTTTGASYSSVGSAIPFGTAFNSNALEFGIMVRGEGSRNTAMYPLHAAATVGYAYGNTVPGSASSYALALSRNHQSAVSGLGNISVGFNNGVLLISGSAGAGGGGIGPVYIQSSNSFGRSTITGGSISFESNPGAFGRVVMFMNSNTKIEGYASVHTLFQAVGNSIPSLQTSFVPDQAFLNISGAGNVSVGFDSANMQWVISGAAGGGGGAAISAGAQSRSTGTINFSASNGVTFGLSANGVMTASVATNYVANRSYVEINQGERLTAGRNLSETVLSNRPQFFPFWIDGTGIVPRTVRMFGSGIAASDRSLGVTLDVALYSQVNSSQLTLLTSAQQSFSITASSQSSAWNGNAVMDFTGMSGFTQTAEGQHVLALNVRPVSANDTWANVVLYGCDPYPSFANHWVGNTTTATNQTNQLLPWQGLYSTTTGAFPASIAKSQIHGGNSASAHQPYAVVMGL